MHTIPHDEVVCQDEEIPFYTEAEITRLPTPEPDTPLADFLAASYNAGEIDEAGADAEVMPLEAWIEAWEHEPDWNFFEDEVTA
jgi:hypothetical protein